MERTNTIDAQIKACWHSIARMYNSYSYDSEFTMSMAYVLMSLSREEGVPSTQIGPQLGMEARSLTRVLKNMEGLGIISKKVGSTDRRQVMIFLTDKGKVYKEAAKQIVRDFNKKIEAQIAPEKLEIFREVLLQINELSEKNHFNPEL